MFTFLLSITTMIIMIKNGDSMPSQTTKLKDLQPSNRERNLSNKQHSLKIRDLDQIVVRIALVFIGFLLIIVLLVCLCAMYWCASLALQWSSTFSSTQSRSSGFSWNRLISRRFRNSRERTREEKDLPPSYEIVLAYQKDDHAVAMNVEEEPPSYSEVLISNFGAS